MIVSEIRLRFNKFATMKIKSYKDGNQVKKYVSTGKEKKAVVGAIMTGLQGLTSIGTGIADYRAGGMRQSVGLMRYRGSRQQHHHLRHQQHSGRL